MQCCMFIERVDMVHDDDSLQAWLDEEEVKANQQKKEHEIARKQNPMPTFEQMKYNFKCQMYAKAIGM